MGTLTVLFDLHYLNDVHRLCRLLGAESITTTSLIRDMRATERVVVSGALIP